MNKIKSSFITSIFSHNVWNNNIMMHISLIHLKKSLPSYFSNFV